MSPSNDAHDLSAGLVICSISIHGLVRGHDMELGRDADTGGQIKYVVELARALAQQPGVARVDLLTRLVRDPEVSSDYAEPCESLGEGARIVRIEAGPDRYIPKEYLWDHLDVFVDNTVAFYQEQGYKPQIVHSHYADAGYVGSRLARILGVPQIHTGHSLGRVKRRRLLASGLKATDIEERYNISQRIAAEETALATAERVITSTRQEIEEQFELYDYYQPDQMEVIPPGTDLDKFHPPQGDEWQSNIAAEITRFLKEPEKPIILALSRPDARKNIGALVCAYGEDPSLQEAANLAIVAGNRDDIGDLDEGAQEVLQELLLLIDRYDLYGKVAYPKHHKSEEVPVIYRLAAASNGVFVNPALTEPFGLTLIEAAASGLPVVATEDGGPRDILENCTNGVLINPLDSQDIARGIREVLLDWESWQRRAISGLEGVRAHYSWDAHAKRYLKTVRAIVERTAAPLTRTSRARRELLYSDRALCAELDLGLLANVERLPELLALMRSKRESVSFIIATGRRLDSALAAMKKYGIPEPDVLIAGDGTTIHYAPKLTEDTAWTRYIEKQWTPQVVRRALKDIPGLALQRKQEQSRFKISYQLETDRAPSLEEIRQRLHQEELAVNTIISCGQLLDVLPMRASKGLALRCVATALNIPLDKILVAGGSGADEGMLQGSTLAVVVGNRYYEELAHLEDREGIYFAEAAGTGSILEAIDYYDFFGRCAVPTEA